MRVLPKKRLDQTLQQGPSRKRPKPSSTGHQNVPVNASSMGGNSASPRRIVGGGRVAPTSPRRRARAFELARHRGALSHLHAPSMFLSVQTTPRREARGQPHELPLRCSRACSWCLNTGMEENSPHNDVALRRSVATCRSLSTTPSLSSSPTPRTGPSAAATRAARRRWTSPRSDDASLRKNAGDRLPRRLRRLHMI
jgi:hypothetical protein